MPRLTLLPLCAGCCVRFNLHFGLASHNFIQSLKLVDSIVYPRPPGGIDLRCKVESDRHEPSVTVHSYQREPVLLVHAVTGKIDSQDWLWQLWGDLFRRQVHNPRSVWLTIQAQVITLRVAFIIKVVRLFCEGHQKARAPPLVVAANLVYCAWELHDVWSRAPTTRPPLFGRPGGAGQASRASLPSRKKNFGGDGGSWIREGIPISSGARRW
mmetsp:Transcript_30596/g.78574  ORF Transcript_30596/g.78574 Transcript_30596/m.78574 type:complete len:212 (+) Transcript_30596:240-875(+)